MKRSTFDINFYCRKSKSNKSQLAPVEVSININQERKFIQLPMKFNPEEFGRKRQPKHISDYLTAMRMKINDAVTDLMMNGEVVTAESLREYLRTGGVKSYTLDNLFNDWLSILGKRVGVDLTHSAYRKYELTMELFFKHVDRSMECTMLKPMDIENFYAELKKEYQPNSSASYMAKVKTAVQFGIDNGKIKINPFQSIRIKRERKEIEFLSENEIKLIQSTEMPTEALERVRDTFLLQCFCGLAYVDMEALRKEDIKEESGLFFISKERIKTGVTYTAVILPEGVEILRKYDFRMPIISNQKTNAALKAIARECGIDRRVYDHLGRKTYGNLLLNGYNGSKPVSMEITAKCLGHSNSKTTAKYYAQVHTSTVLSEVASALRK